MPGSAQALWSGFPWSADTRIEFAELGRNPTHIAALGRSREVHGGRFVSGFLGEQFALPAAQESLRATRAEPPTGETITISAADPLNLGGIIVPGAKVLAISSRFVTYRDGVALEVSQPLDCATVRQAG